MKNLLLSLSDDTFATLKKDFDDMLNETLYKMEDMKSDEAVVTVKLNITLTEDTAPDLEQTAYEAVREIIRPKFEHKVGASIAVKAEKKGKLEGEYEMVYDRETGKYVLRPLTNGQLSFDDLEDGGIAMVDESGVVQNIKYPDGERE